MTRHEIQILRAVGMAQTAIAAKTGVSVRSVRRIEDEPGVRSSDTAALIRARVVEPVRFFASRLKWSRFVDVTLVPDEREEALIRGLLHALEAFRGVPLVTVWDNPKTVVLARKGELIVWNPVFGQVALDYRFAPELCWPRAGQQKGAVENLVGWVKKSFFTCRRFHDRADLEHHLGADLQEQVVTLMTTLYDGFNDVHLTEKLRERHALPV